MQVGPGWAGAAALRFHFMHIATPGAELQRSLLLSCQTLVTWVKQWSSALALLVCALHTPDQSSVLSRYHLQNSAPKKGKNSTTRNANAWLHGMHWVHAPELYDTFWDSWHLSYQTAHIRIHESYNTAG